MIHDQSQRCAPPVGRPEHFVGLIDVECKGFLTQNVFARFGCRNRNVLVQVVRQTDRDGGYVVVSQEVVVIVMNADNVKLPC